MTYQRRYSYSHIHTTAGTDADPIVVTGPLQYPTLQAAMDAAENGQPTERATRWNPAHTNKASELSDWQFGTVTAPGHEVVVCAHPAEADAAIILAAWRLARTQKPVTAPAYQPAPPLLSVREYVHSLASEPAPKYCSDEQWAKYAAIHARAGTTPPTSREKLDAAAERLWRKAHGLAPL